MSKSYVITLRFASCQGTVTSTAVLSGSMSHSVSPNWNGVDKIPCRQTYKRISVRKLRKATFFLLYIAKAVVSNAGNINTRGKAIILLETNL
jgi:hypothetical protein